MFVSGNCPAISTQFGAMSNRVLIAGGGIGGLAAALACVRAGMDVQLYERAAAFGEVGAGIQIGPNVVHVLRRLGLEGALASVAAFPRRLQIRDALSGRELGVLPLADRSVELYGAPYATIHRADLHALLLEALEQEGSARLKLGCWLANFSNAEHRVSLETTEGLVAEGDALIGADGLWSRVRELLLNDGAPRVSGHLAYRAMLPQEELPVRLRSQQVTAWLGPRLHVVQYPVRCGEWLNVVAIVHGEVSGTTHGWDHAANAAELRHAMGTTDSALQDLIAAVPAWRLWALCDRPPMTGPSQQASGRVALLGDAAHPMRPYLAQGAGMAIEDAEQLARSLSLSHLTMHERLQHYASLRWRRCARVQARSIRNGTIFHSEGLVRRARDLAMKALGERLLDVPWLYRGPAGQRHCQ